MCLLCAHLCVYVLFVCACCIFSCFCVADLVSGCKIYIQAGTALTRCCQPMSASFHPFRFYILSQNMCRVHPDKDFINSLAIILVVFLCSIWDFPIWVFVLLCSSHSRKKFPFAQCSDLIFFKPLLSSWYFLLDPSRVEICRDCDDRWSHKFFPGGVILSSATRNWSSTSNSCNLGSRWAWKEPKKRKIV